MGKDNRVVQIKEIMKMSIPLMVQGLVFQMQSLTDKAFLGNLDTKYVSAIGSASMPFNACMDSFAAISTGLIILKMAIYTLTFGCQCIVYVAIAGIAKGMMTLIGQKKGAGKLQEADQVFVTGICINFLFVILGASLFMVMPENILSIFSNDNDVIRQGAPYLIGIGFILFPQSMNTVCGGAIRANGNTRWMLNTQMIGSILVLCLSFVLVKVIHMEMIAVYITLFVDETVRGLLNLVYYRVKYGYKKEADLLGD